MEYVVWSCQNGRESSCKRGGEAGMLQKLDSEFVPLSSREKNDGGKEYWSKNGLMF